MPNRLILLLVPVIAALLWVATEAQSHNPAGQRACFPASVWSADFDRLPCHYLVPPREDSSGRLYLGTASRAVAVCRIPNPYEERRRFVIRCQKVGR